MKYYLAIIFICTGLFIPLAQGTPPQDLSVIYREHARPLSATSDLTPLISAAKDKRLVLLGESSHGTREFYTWRTEISRRLIETGGVSFIAVEGDWISLARLNRYIRHEPWTLASARHALMIPNRWPRWMWANEEFVEFAEWLRAFNSARSPENRVSLYGIDIFSPWEAMDAVLDWYHSHHPDQFDRITDHYATFAAFRDDPHGYARAVEAMDDQERGVAKALRNTIALWQNSQDSTRQAAFFAKQSAHVVSAAEEYYRTMGQSASLAWNTRATHMHETVGRLLAVNGTESKGIVWAHNTHIGDARATSMVQRGMHNIGQLSRQQLGENNVFLVGFTTGQGTVLASRQWGGPRESMRIPSPPNDSFEAVLKTLAMGDALLIFPPSDALPPVLQHTIGHRAIGVIYQPEQDHRQYVPTTPARRYNALLYVENSTALTPLHEKE
ncbi:MAG: erythromycin esterase family protein [Nitrosomonas sp.]|nr:erythromycin esterase family protein [Nitrosomonas sp.]